MRKFFENKFVFGVTLSLFACAFGWNVSQGSALPAAHFVMDLVPLIAHGAVPHNPVPPDPWDTNVTALNHNPVPPDPWDTNAAVA